MKLNLTPFFALLILLVAVVSCGYNNQGTTKLYYSVIKRDKAVDQKDTVYASSDLAAVDSTIRRYYEAMAQYNAEKAKNVNNPYNAKPTEWHAVTTEGKYVTSVSDKEVQEIEKKYNTAM